MKLPLETLRRICSRLPDSEETMTWGKPHFRVAGKIFAGFGEEEGKPVIGLKLEKGHAEARVRNDPRFSMAPYVVPDGWVSIGEGAYGTRPSLPAGAGKWLKGLLLALAATTDDSSYGCSCR